MDVARKRRLGRVEISVRVDVKHAELLSVTFCGSGGSGKRAENDRVIAAERKRKFSRGKRVIRFFCKLRAGIRDRF